MNTEREVVDIKTKKPKKFKNKHKPKTASDFEKASTLNFSDCESSSDRLNQIQIMLLGTMQVAEGLYREHPTQSNCYSLSNVIEKYQSISDQIEDSVDYEELADECMSVIVQPFVESMILELGKSIRNELRDMTKLKPKTKQRIKKSFDTVFKKFGMTSESKLKDLETDLFEFLES